MRAPFQLIVLPYRDQEDTFEVLVCKRSDDHYWQCVAGGGEWGETQLDAAIRELEEETKLTGVEWLELDSRSSIPKFHFQGNENWKDHPYVIPEYAFSVQVFAEPTLSSEHTEYKWCNESEANQLLHYDSNKTAVWELFQRLSR